MCPKSLKRCAAAGHEGVQAGPGAGVLRVRDAVQPGPVHGHVHTLRGVVSRGPLYEVLGGHSMPCVLSIDRGERLYSKPRVHTLRGEVR